MSASVQAHVACHFFIERTLNPWVLSKTAAYDVVSIPATAYPQRHLASVSSHPPAHRVTYSSEVSSPHLAGAGTSQLAPRRDSGHRHTPNSRASQIVLATSQDAI